MQTQTNRCDGSRAAFFAGVFLLAAGAGGCARQAASSDANVCPEAASVETVDKKPITSTTNSEAESKGTAYEDVFHEALHCVGNEPFWNLEISSSQDAHFRVMEQADRAYRVAGVTASVNHIGVWSLRLVGVHDESERVVLVHRNESCSDGMSDRQYSYEVHVWGAPFGLATGCCNAKPDVNGAP